MPLRTANGRPYASALPRVRWGDQAVVADGICRYENRLAHVVMRHYGEYNGEYK